MNKVFSSVVLFVGSFLGLVGLSQAGGVNLPSASDNNNDVSFNGRQSVEDIVNKLLSHFPNVDPQMIVTMAKIESSFDPMAYRYEKHLDDASIGLMQTLVATARWLASDMGYSAYGIPDKDDLYDPETSLYFGMAYVDYLRKWKGRTRSEDWIVQSYNGGPNNSNSMTRNHLNKYHKTKRELYA